MHCDSVSLMKENNEGRQKERGGRENEKERERERRQETKKR